MGRRRPRTTRRCGRPRWGAWRRGTGRTGCGPGSKAPPARGRTSTTTRTGTRWLETDGSGHADGGERLSRRTGWWRGSTASGTGRSTAFDPEGSVAQRLEQRGGRALVELGVRRVRQRDQRGHADGPVRVPRAGLGTTWTGRRGCVYCESRYYDPGDGPLAHDAIRSGRRAASNVYGYCASGPVGAERSGAGFRSRSGGSLRSGVEVSKCIYEASSRTTTMGATQPSEFARQLDRSAEASRHRACTAADHDGPPHYHNRAHERNTGPTASMLTSTGLATTGRIGPRSGRTGACRSGGATIGNA